MKLAPIHFAACLMACILLITSCKNEGTTPENEPPSWAAEAIWYQIFVERFNNGDNTNDPKAPDIRIPPMGVEAPENWTTTPWGSDWYTSDAWANPEKPFHNILQNRRYGGDLQGVINKLDYLLDLGVTALYLNPINHAPSLHKYDASYYHHVDANFGPDPEGDKKMMAAENPNDPNTWQWTAADKLFLKLVEEVHRRGMKIILDFSWNHTGTLFWAWQDILQKGEASPYKDWYAINRYDNPETEENEFSYEGWLNIQSLPEIRKVNITTPRVIGMPYEGNINPEAKAHIYEVTKRWLAPDGDISKGIDGYRLDVADHIGLGFWRDWRKHVRSVSPNAYIIGEIWWEQWPDRLMDPVPYTGGDIFDAVMFYQAYRPAKYFFSTSDFSIDARQLKDSLEREWKRLLPANRYAMMNVSSTHDAPRLLTCFDNPTKYKYQALPWENPAYNTGRPDEETYVRTRLYLIHLFTSIGAPQIWNGDEMGMWGGDDPDCRKPLWWKEVAFEPESPFLKKNGDDSKERIYFNDQHFLWYKNLIAMRKSNPVLVHGDIEFILTEGQRLGYRRFNDKEEVLVFFNLEGSECTFTLPKAATYTNLLNGTKTNGATEQVGALEAVVLKKD